MKKINKLIIFLITVCISILCINIYIVNEYQRIRHLEKEISQDCIYLKEETIETDKLLNELSELSDKYKVSFVKTASSNNDYYKLLMINGETFPYESFGGEFKKDDLPKNLPVFMNIGSLTIADMNNYYKETGDSVNGEYTIISNEPYDRDSLVKELSGFLSTSPEELIKKSQGSSYSYINNTSIFSTIAILVFLLALLFVSVYSPLVNMDKIGIQKLLGIKEIDILKSYMLGSILTIVITSIIIDIGIYIINSYIPDNFYTSLIIMQLSILLVYMIIGLLLNKVINHITISNMIKGFVSMKWVHFINFALKIIVSIFVVGSLYMLSMSFDFTFDSLKKADFYTRKSPNYLTGEYINESNERLFMKSKEYSKIPYDAYKNMVKNIDDVCYIDYRKFEPYWSNNSYEKGKSFDVLNVNDNYIKKLGFNPNIGENVLYVPSTMKDVNIEEMFAYYFYQTNNIKEIEEDKLKDIDIDIYYYDKDIEAITYDEDKPLVKNPIISLVDDMNMNSSEMQALSNTGINNPIKIENTKKNREIIDKIYKKYNGEYYMKFSPISSIFKDRLEEYKSFIIKVSIALISLIILSIFVSFFIIQGYFLTENRYLNVTKILGHRLIDRFRILFILIGILDLAAIIVLSILTKNRLILAIFSIFILIDILLIIAFIKVKDNKNLVAKLKGV